MPYRFFDLLKTLVFAKVFLCKEGVFVLPSNKPVATLQQIANIYDQSLAGKILTFPVKHKETPFHVKFDEGHLAHLLGLHYFGYKKGEAIYQTLLDGNITWEILKAKNEGTFKENEFRMLFFIYIVDVLSSPKIIIYDKERSQSRIDADFMFYSEQNKRFLSLGIRKEDDPSEFYIPVTFLESKKNKWTNAKHIPLHKSTITI